MILRAEEEMLAWDDLKLILDELELAVDSGDQGKLRQLLIKAVPGLNRKVILLIFCMKLKRWVMRNS